MRVFRIIVAILFFCLGILTTLGSIIGIFVEGMGYFILNMILTGVIFFLPAYFICPKETRIQLVDIFKGANSAERQQYQTNNSREPNTRDQTLNARQLKALYKLSQNILADDVIDESEVHDLENWFEANPAAESDTRTKLIWSTLLASMIDGVLDNAEELEIYTALTEFCSGFENVISQKRAVQKKSKVTHSARIGVSELEPNGRYELVYEDSMGDISQRPVIFRDLESRGGRQNMTAVCQNKTAVRTIRIDRIQYLASLETGEIFVDD